MTLVIVTTEQTRTFHVELDELLKVYPKLKELEVGSHDWNEAVAHCWHGDLDDLFEEVECLVVEPEISVRRPKRYV